MKEFIYHQTKNILITLKGEELVEKKTPYQSMKLIQTNDLGRVLLLGATEKNMTIQFSEKDEKYYHEAITHPILALSKTPEKILILGGGDGGVIREVLKHPVSKVKLVELDKEVIEFCKANFDFSKKALEIDKVEIIINDGKKFLEETDEKYDIIIIDLTDPEGPSKFLFTKEFYELVKRRLNKQGIMISQTSSPTFEPYVLGRVNKTLKGFFKNVITYTTTVPSFFCIQSFTIATDNDNKKIAETLKERNILLNAYTPEELERMISEKNSHIKDVLKQSWDISTDADPVCLKW